MWIHITNLWCPIRLAAAKPISVSVRKEEMPAVVLGLISSQQENMLTKLFSSHCSGKCSLFAIREKVLELEQKSSGFNESEEPDSDAGFISCPEETNAAQP